MLCSFAETSLIITVVLIHSRCKQIALRALPLFQPEEPGSIFSTSAMVPGAKTDPGLRRVFSKGPRTVGADFAVPNIADWSNTGLMCAASFTQ